jgi:trans-2,3-dihydro-3-hydroxyanthranilate isomerase
MRVYSFVTVDVFTDRRFGGNPLAVFTDGRGLSDAEMQALAREFNLSEITFVLPPQDPAHTARVRIFTPAAEMPFAGHPSVGTGYVLAQEGAEGLLTFEVPAGVVEVRVDRSAAGAPIGATIDAPQPLSVGLELSAETVAACAGLEPADIVVAAHRPVLASVGTGLVMAQVTEAALGRARPVVDRFREAEAVHPELSGGLSLHLYAPGEQAIRARMFAPFMGVPEDPATGSANAALGALLLSLTEARSAQYSIVQGVEMGRPSLLQVTARRAADGVRATVGGGCVAVMRGEAVL